MTTCLAADSPIFNQIRVFHNFTTAINPTYAFDFLTFIRSTDIPASYQYQNQQYFNSLVNFGQPFLYFAGHKIWSKAIKGANNRLIRLANITSKYFLRRTSFIEPNMNYLGPNTNPPLKTATGVNYAGFPACRTTCYLYFFTHASVDYLQTLDSYNFYSMNIYNMDFPFNPTAIGSNCSRGCDVYINNLATDVDGVYNISYNIIPFGAIL